MDYKNFSSSFWDNLSKTLEEELFSHPNPVAAFDADGTLWDTDLGEAFFKWQIKNCSLPNLPPDPWSHYRRMKSSGDPRPAYLWLAQINKGQKFSQVQQWAEKCVKDMSPLPIFSAQQKLISLFLQKGVRVYIVTASIKWSVEPGAKLLQVPSKNVLGVCTKIESGVVSDQPDGDITYREGKLTALLKATNGVKPFFACGNSPGDESLLKAATRISLAVGAAPRDHELFDSEEKLRHLAQSQGWWVHKFC